MKTQFASWPDNPGSEGERLQLVVDWWNSLRDCGESGATTWEELEKLEQEVTECLARDEPDIEQAESLTAKAILLIAGCTES